jgi:hypothetical protein
LGAFQSVKYFFKNDKKIGEHDSCIIVFEIDTGTTKYEYEHPDEFATPIGDIKYEIEKRIFGDEACDSSKVEFPWRLV